MTAVTTAAYPDVHAAGGVVAGMPYGCAHAAPSPYPCMQLGATRGAAPCGTAAASMLDVDLCAAYRLGTGWVLG
ncbi:hypothetical protein [Actinacidiphila sp. bgisy167]|uniref:hypothetical protein n=1 Tax=Actinacidiphila sp. bgisy167 TaxID=3413797 RepID=UPI003D75F8D6